MGFLDSILKKKKAPEAGEEDTPPEAVETVIEHIEHLEQATSQQVLKLVELLLRRPASSS